MNTLLNKLFSKDLFTKMVLTLSLVLGATQARGDETLTVNTGNQKTIQQVPVYGPICGSDNTLPYSEFIVASKDLTVMNGATIKSMTFYISNSNSYSWGDAEFEVYLKEVNDTTFSSNAFYGKESSETVYNGALSITSGLMTITFQNNYLYNGGNLLIGICCTKKGTSTVTYAFYFNGYANPDNQYGTYYCAYYANATATTPNKGNVKPKTTFTYSTSSGSVPAPKSFAASDISHNSATLGWTAGGEETQWQLYYSTTEGEPDGEAELIEVDTNSKALSGLTANTLYYAYVRAYVDETHQSTWTSTTFTTYEEYPTPTSLTASNYEGEGDVATLSWTNGPGTEATKWQIRYSTSSTFETETLVENVTDNPYTLTGLTANTTYYACVRADYGSSHYSSWSDKVSFTPIEAWETFSDGIPDSWYNESSHWITTRSGYVGMASATSSSYELRSPRLYMQKDETVRFDVKVSSSLSLRYYKSDRSASTATSYATYTESGRYTFTAPSTGYYWLQFKGYNCGVDNFSGVEPAETEHLMGVSITNMISTGTVGGDYTATAKVSELGGIGDTYTIQLIYDDEIVAEKTSQAINGNRDDNVNLTFTPTEAKAAQMKFKIIYNGGESYKETGWRTVTMSNTTYILDEYDSSEQPGSSSSFYNKVLCMKFTAQNKWNTICVPFILNDSYLQQIFGSEYKIYKIKSYSDNVLAFETVSLFATSTPYLVYAEDVSGIDADNILLKDVSIATSNWSSANKTQTKGDATFQGTFAPIAAGGMEGKYGITTEGKLGKGSSSASIKGYRAYFELPAGARPTIAFDDEEGGTTDLSFLKMVDPEAKDVYTLSGQKVEKAGKGIYIVNGRKVVIK